MTLFAKEPSVENDIDILGRLFRANQSIEQKRQFCAAHRASVKQAESALKAAEAEASKAEAYRDEILREIDSYMPRREQQLATQAAIAEHTAPAEEGGDEDSKWALPGDMQAGSEGGTDGGE